MANSGTFRKGDGRQRRPKGVPNKVTGELKEMILRALSDAGGVTYLVKCARENPAPFLALVGKVLPLQVTGESGQPIPVSIAFVIQQQPDSENRT